MNAFYSEWEPFAAQWLRNLAAAGEIPEGTVDERDVRELQATDLLGRTRVGLFAGTGAWELALRLAGWPDDRPVWTGSCPCQPWSSAGKGTCADDPRDLWPTWVQLIRQLRPSIVFGEQIASADGRSFLDRVYANLEASDYAVGAANLPACGVGTPHIRYRLWFVADADKGRRGRQSARQPALDGEWDMATPEQAGRSVSSEAGSGLQSSWPAGPGTVGRIPIATDGVSDVVAGRNAAGNAIVPQVAATFIEAYLDCCGGLP